MIFIGLQIGTLTPFIPSRQEDVVLMLAAGYLKELMQVITEFIGCATHHKPGMTAPTARRVVIVDKRPLKHMGVTVLLGRPKQAPPHLVVVIGDDTL